MNLDVCVFVCVFGLGNGACDVIILKCLIISKMWHYVVSFS